jgi:hypothetical protein
MENKIYDLLIKEIETEGSLDLLIYGEWFNEIKLIDLDKEWVNFKVNEEEFDIQINEIGEILDKKSCHTMKEYLVRLDCIEAVSKIVSKLKY